MDRGENSVNRAPGSEEWQLSVMSPNIYGDKYEAIIIWSYNSTYILEK